MGNRFQFPVKFQSFLKKDMRDSSTYAGQDIGGNWWYLNELNQSIRGLLGSGSGKDMVDFDMSRDTHKRLALNYCTPFAMVVNKCGSFLSTGRYYVQDKNGNEIESPDARRIRSLLRKPNTLQSGRSFTKQIEVCLKTFGYCPVYTLRATSKSIPETMVVIPPELFHQTGTGKVFKQVEESEIINKTYIDWGGERLYLEPEEYFVIVDSEIVVPQNNGSEISYNYIADTLSHPVSNWMAQMIARGTLIKNGGPKGIIYNNDTSEFQNASLTGKEKDDLNNTFKRKYGLVNKLFSIWVTQKRVGWIPLTFNADQLKLHTEDKQCLELISNAIGVEPSVFSSDSKYDNKDSSKIGAYQDLIIPDSENYTETLTDAICPDGLFIKMDFSHVPCLQKDKSAESTTLKNTSDSIIKLMDSGLISKDEARIKLSEYLDINPNDKI